MERVLQSLSLGRDRTRVLIKVDHDSPPKSGDLTSPPKLGEMNLRGNQRSTKSDEMLDHMIGFLLMPL